MLAHIPLLPSMCRKGWGEALAPKQIFTSQHLPPLKAIRAPWRNGYLQAWGGTEDDRSLKHLTVPRVKKCSRTMWTGQDIEASLRRLPDHIRDKISITGNEGCHIVIG